MKKLLIVALLIDGFDNWKNKADYYTSGGVPENYRDCYEEGVCVSGCDN